ncbi:hypothetical protein [Luteimicrobium sp. DT211]|uniref:hypothetical protein n=1 Tax=Luteimicrobium sp. DT211 TaxID=3393412 RepID=UPI003CF0C837
MSTTPGDETLRDAGLLPDDVAVDPDLDHLTHRRAPEPDSLDEDEYEPAVPRPDLDGEADEADVVEQADEVPAEDEDGGRD